MENKLVLKKNELSFLLSLIRLMEIGVRALTDVGSKSKISDGSEPRPSTAWARPFSYGLGYEILRFYPGSVLTFTK